MPVSWGIEEDVGGQSSSAGRRASRRRTMAILFLLHPSTTKSPTHGVVCMSRDKRTEDASEPGNRRLWRQPMAVFAPIPL